MTLDDPTTRRLAFAGVSALTVLTWYALPDAVRSRGARVVIKTGLLGVTAAGVAMMPQVYPEARTFRPQRGIWGEKAIYARGERRRARGVRCAHTPAAVAMAMATGVVTVVDWPKLAGRLTES